MKNDPKDPSQKSQAWNEMSQPWTVINAVLGGTATMRKSGRSLTPQHQEETEEGYRARLMSTTLYNVTSITLESLVGRPFSDPLRLNDDVPQEIKDIEGEIGVSGDDMHTVCRRWFRDGLAKGLSHVLIDMPPLEETEDGRPRTLADDILENRKPYWTVIEPENILGASYDTINGKKVLTSVRIAETELVNDGFSEIRKDRVRVLYPGRWEVHEQTERSVWTVVEKGETGLDEIPLVTFYADRVTDFVSKPPIEDLAYLNVRHWQSTSDQINVLTVARFPMLAVSGARNENSDGMAIGPKQLLSLSEANGRFYYVEHSGKAIEAGRNDIADLEQQMAAYGAEFLRKRPSGATATARALDSAEATSPLQDHTLRMQSAIQQALLMTAKWLDLEDGGTAKLVTDYGPETLEGVDLQILTDMSSRGLLSDLDLFLELKRRGLLRDNFDPEENYARLLEDFKRHAATAPQGVVEEDKVNDEPDS